MRRFVFTIFFLSLFLFALRYMLYAPGVSAQGYELLSSGQVIDSDYIRAANTVQIDGEVKGDAFLAGGLVTVNGKVDGDLFVAGGKVNVNGAVGNSVRIIGGDVTINGPVGRNVLIVCGNCSVTRQATIAGSLLATAGNLEVSAGKIGRGFRFFGNRLYLNSEIASEAFVVADREFLLGPQASISGSLKYTGSNEVVVEPGATVAGNIAYERTNQGETYPRFFGVRGAVSSYKRLAPLADLFGFVVSAIVGFILLGLFPRGFEKTVRAIENRPYASLGWGAILAAMLPLVVVLFALTIVGLPVSILLILVGFVVLEAAKYVIAFFVGRRILLPRFGERRGWAIVLGLFLIYLLGLIPVLGAVVKLVLLLFGLGAMAVSYRQPVIIEHKMPAELMAPRRRGRPRKVQV